ncbi:MAG: TonB-dependent receptor [Desulfobacterales bacterium]|nr:TonB-dependent receptor [Desulfobacterales bacterium]
MKRLFVVLSLLFIFTTEIIASDETLDQLVEYMKAESIQYIKSAGKKPEKTLKIPASVVIITRKDIETYGYRTLTEIIEHTIGYYNINNYSNVSGNFGVRGILTEKQPNSNIAILVNGITQFDASISEATPFSRLAVPVEAIDHIEVIRGPLSIMYGSGASLGAMNIVTTDTKAKTPVSLASVSVGKEGTDNYTEKAVVRMSGKEDHFTYGANASVYKTDGINVKLKDMVSNFEDKNKTDPLFGISDPEYSTENYLEGNQKYCGFTSSYKNFYFDSSYHETFQKYFYMRPSVGEGTYIDEKTTNALIGYNRKFSDVLSIDYKLRYSETTRMIRFNAGNENIWAMQFNNGSLYEIELINILSPIQKVDVTIGLNYLDIQGNVYKDLYIVTHSADGFKPLVPNRLDQDEPYNKSSLYTQADINPIPDLKIVMGIRMDYMSRRIKNIEQYDPDEGDLVSYAIGTVIKDSLRSDHDTVIYSRAAAVYTLNSSNIIKLMYGEAIRNNAYAPSGDENETTKTLEMNYIYLNPLLTVQAGIYGSQVEHLEKNHIEYTDGQYISTVSYDGKVRMYGMELLFKKEFDAFAVELGGSYQDVEDQHLKDIDYPYSPVLLGQFKTSYRFGKHCVSLTGYYVDEMESSWDPTANNYQGGRIANKVPGYFLAGANWRWDNIYKEIYMDVRCSNMLDKEIRYPASNNNSYLDKGSLGERISVMLSIGTKF